MIAVFCHLQSFYLYDIKKITGLFRNLYIRSEYRSEKDDLVSLIQQEILLQGIEDVTHGGSSAFGSEKVEYSLGGPVVT